MANVNPPGRGGGLPNKNDGGGRRTFRGENLSIGTT